MYYADSTPDDCIPFTISYVTSGSTAASNGTASNATATSSVATVPSTSASSVATFTGAANALQAGSAVAVGVVGAMLAMLA